MPARPSPSGAIDALAVALQGTFPQCDDPPLAVALIRTLAEGQPVAAADLARTSGRPETEVAAALTRWPNVHLDQDSRVTGFGGLSLTPTAHHFDVAGQSLYTWCAWDTLFLPTLLDQHAEVRSTCPVTGADVRLRVSPTGVESVEPAERWVSFPAASTTTATDITGSFCCHVHFLASPTAVEQWKRANAGGVALTVDEAFELGRRCTDGLTCSGPEAELDVVRRGFEAVARRDFDAVGDVLHPEVVWHGAEPEDEQDGCHNRPEALAFIREALDRGVTVELLELRVVGGRIVAILQQQGDPDNERPGPHGEIITVREGKIREMLVYPSADEALAAAQAAP